MPYRPLSPERAGRVFALHGDKRTLAEVAAAFGVSETTAGAWHKMLDLVPHRPPTASETFWTPERLADGRRIAHEQGITPAAARALGCGINVFRAKADAEGWPRRDLDAERRAAADAAAAEAKRLKAEGLRPVEIARRMGVTDSTVSAYLRRPDPASGVDGAQDGATPTPGGG